MNGPAQVDIEIGDGVGEAGRDGNLRGQMEHSAGLACRFGQRRPVANVGDDGGNQTRMAASEPSRD